MKGPSVVGTWLAVTFLLPLLATADVVVISNRSPQTVALSVWATDASGNVTATPPRTAVLPMGELAAIPCAGTTQMAFRTTEQEGAYLLDANCAYFFAPDSAGKIDLHKIGLGEDETTLRGTGLVEGELLDKMAVVPVKLLVDDDEISAPPVWEARLRRRVATASQILEKHCRVRLEVVAVGTWVSDNDVNDFVGTLREFEKNVRPAPARLAIGFTSQYGERTAGAHLGGTRGPLHPFILIREAAQGLSEAERLEILLHELGHYLGAVHSPEFDSAMRPQLGDQRARAAEFRVGFDPVNTLAINLFADELRVRNVANLGGLSEPTKLRLQQVYETLGQAMPDDFSARQYISLIRGGRKIEPKSPDDPRLAVATRHVVQGIVQAARENQRLPWGNQRRGQRGGRVDGDALTSFYVRAAAKSASQLPPEQAATAMMLGLGIALDDSDILRKQPKLSTFCRHVETTEERQARISLIGKPTIFRRRDLTQHFFVSGFLTAMVGPTAAESAGVAKELVDATSGSGFSFIDLAANKAGIRFAEAILRRQLTLAQVAAAFKMDHYMPEIDDLPEGLGKTEFLLRFGTGDDERYQDVVKKIERRIDALSGY